MDAPFRVTRLGPRDLARMRDLNALFGRAFEDPQSYHSAPPSDGYLTDLLARDHTHVVVALRGETVIGGA